MRSTDVVRSKYGDQTLSQFQDPQAYRNRKKKSKGGKAVKIVLIVVLAVIVAVGAACAVYFQTLKGNLKYQGDLDALMGALTEADYEQPFYVLVVGSDNWESYGARSDAICLVRVDLNKPQLTLVSIPRDTQYTWPDGTVTKLNQVFSDGGVVATIDAVEELTGVEISHYVEVEFDGLKNVVDGLGGITVNVPYEFWYTVYTNDQETVHVAKGKQTLTGEQAVALARMRKAYTSAQGGDVTEDSIRQTNIRNMMVAIMKEVLSGDISEVPGRVAMVTEMVQTDLSLETIIDWATKVYGKDMTVYSTTGPTEGQAMSTYGGQWLTYNDPEAWSQLMAVVDSGDDPSKVVETKTTSEVVTTGE